MAYPTKNPDRATFWLQRVEHSGECLKEYYEAGDRIRRMYENWATTEREELLEESDLGGENIGRIKPSVVFQWIDQSIANQVFREPTFRIRGKTKESVDGAPVVGKVVNHWFQQTKQKEQDKRVLLDAYCYPFGVKKTGFTQNADEERKLSELSDLVFDDAEEENLFLAIGDPTVVTEDQDQGAHITEHEKLMAEDDIDDDIKENVIAPHIEEHVAIRDGVVFEEAHENVEEDQPYGLRHDPKWFRFDPTSSDGLRDAGWIAFGFERRLSDVQANPNYKNTRDLKPTGRLVNAPERLRPWDDDPDDDDFGMIVLWEVWARRFPVAPGKRRNLLIVIAEQQGDDGSTGKILRHDDEWPYKRLKSFPAKLLCFHKSPVGWVSRPMLHMAGADNIQALVNEMLDSYLSTMRKQKNIIFYDSDIFTGEQVEDALQTPKDGAVGVQGLSKAQGQPIITLPFTAISGQKTDLISTMLELFNLTAGTPGPGLGTDSDETATEAAINERRATAREAMRSDEYEQFQIETAEDFWALHTQYLADQEFPIDAEANEWATVEGDVVRGSYRFEIDVASHATALAIERKQWMDLLNLMAGIAPTAVQLGMPPPNLPWLAEQLMVRGYEIPNPEEVWPAIGQEAGVGGLAGAPPGVPGGAPGFPAQVPGNGGVPGPPTPGPAQPAAFQAPVPRVSGIAADAEQA